MKNVAFHRPDGRNLQIEIIRYQAGDLTRNRSMGRHRHGFNTLMLVQKGLSEQEIDLQDYRLAPQQLAFIPKGAIHWEKEMVDFEAYIILFNDEFFYGPQLPLLDGLTEYAIAKGELIMTLASEQFKEMEAYFDLLYQEQQAPVSQNQTFILQNLMLALINKIEGLIQHNPNPNSFISQRQIFQQFIVLLKEHYRSQKSVGFYTEQLQLPAKKLNGILKEIVGKTAQDLIIDKVLLEAKREICYSTQSLKEIAYYLGYENPFYFSRIFKKRLTLSPEEFRKRYAQ